MAVILKCKMCGGDLNAPEGAKVVQCEFCGTQQTIPSVDDERKANLFNRANSLRSANEFDRAIGIYENIVNEFPEEAEAYWGLVLCKYGIEYVDDPVTHRKVPTCHRTSYESVFDDVNYKQAMSFADPVAKDVYRSEAEAVNEIQKGILSIAKNEKPFDVFICYKESDDLGRRTPDSVLAQDIYYELQRDGFKVFFSRITLEGKLGTAYEPYIFAALNSAKVMVVVGTKPEYYNAVWVKNEWSRFLDMMKKDKSKVIIPAYKDMDPYDLPDALSMFQAQDMGKLGFMQDLIRGITKLAGKDEEKPVQTVVQQTVAAPAAGSNVENLLKRGFMALEDGKWSEADSFFEQVLNENVEEPRAYLGKLMARLKYRTEKDFETGLELIADNDNYKKAYRFADETYKDKLNTFNCASFYNNALIKENDAENDADPYNKIELFSKAEEFYGLITGYKDAEHKKEACLEKIEDTKENLYNDALAHINKADVENSTEEAMAAKDIFEYLASIKYNDSVKKLSELNEFIEKLGVYIEAEKTFKHGYNIHVINSAIEIYKSLGDFKDSKEKIEICYSRIADIRTIGKREKYQSACSDMQKDTISTLRDAIKKFNEVIDFEDSADKIKQCEERIQQIENETILTKKKAKRKKLIIAISAVATIVMIISISIIKPAIDYNKAMSLYKNGSYSEAISAFEALEYYGNSQEMVTDIKNAQEVQQQIQNSEINDTVYFGSYNGKSLVWNVLSKDDEKALLLCTEYIRYLSFNSSGDADASWETSYIRYWLNDTYSAYSFINSAFTSAGRELIMPVSINNYDDAKGYYTTYDNIFLLDESEANTYKGALSIIDDSFWLRTSYSTQQTASVYSHGSIFQSEQNDIYNEVVPAMYVRLK